ncbi:conjugal transfer protein TraG [Dyadobacter luteus]|uniref:Conjugal transfer protein TraG n=2 Tax=Dyadobacter luteus TaxID=2259619 RepID=A0A3D8Y9R0_9BACT|nr:conjugal transfer protein TraG [Dyadobacter luteus]
MEKRLEDILPIMGVEKGAILSKNADITIGYKVELPELFSLSNQEYEALHSTWIRALKVLPDNTVFCKQDWFLDSKYQPDFNRDDKSFISMGSERFFFERPFLDHSCYVFLTKKPDGRKLSSSLFSNLTRPSIVPQQGLSESMFDDFLDACGQFKSIVESSGVVQLERLSQDSLLSTSARAGVIEKYCNLSDPGRLISDMEFTGGIQIGAQTCQLYTLSDAKDLPSLCGPRVNYDKYSTDKTKFSIGFASPLGQLLGCNHLYSQYIFLEDGHKAIQRLETKRLRLQSLSAYSRENSIARDAANDFLNEAVSEHRMPVKAHFNILVWTDEKQKLKEIKNLVSAALAQMDASAKQETAGAPQIYWAGIPGNAADFPMNDTFDTFAEQACCFLNLETAYRSSKSPFGIRLGDRHTGIPVHVDISDEPMSRGVITNRNKIVIGGSGSGKSMFMNHMLHSYVQQGSHVLIVDVGHSYKGLCDMLGGYYFTYSEKTPIRFNPFFIGEGDELDTEKKESIKTMLLALWKRDNEEFKRSEYVAISNALTDYYEYLAANPEIFPCFDSFYEFLYVEFTQTLAEDRVKEKDFDMDNFLFVLRPYYDDGEFAYLLNAKENLDVLTQPFIVFELDKVKDHPILFPVITLIIMELFISKMRKLNKIRKVICIEEAWQAIAKAGMAQFMKYLYKTVRKYYGEAITVTQEVDDIISSPIIKDAIINNSDCKILLDLKKFQNKFEDIQAVLGMNDKGRAQVLSVNKANDPKRRYRELYIELGNSVMKVYRYEPSPEEYYAYTTEQKEKVLVEQYAARHGSIQKGIAALLSDQKQ